MHSPVDITFRGMTPSAAVEAAIGKWTARLERLHGHIQRCDVVVEEPHRHQRQGRQFHVRITLAVPGGELVVSQDPGRDEAHEDVYIAVRDAFQAARRQLEDHIRRQRGDVKTHVAER